MFVLTVLYILLWSDYSLRPKLPLVWHLLGLWSANCLKLKMFKQMHWVVSQHESILETHCAGFNQVSLLPIQALLSGLEALADVLQHRPPLPPEPTDQPVPDETHRPRTPVEPPLKVMTEDELVRHLSMASIPCVPTDNPRVEVNQSKGKIWIVRSNGEGWWGKDQHF